MKDRHSIQIIFAFIATYFIWGSTYMFNKIVVSEVPPFLGAGIRFTSAGIIVVILMLFLGKKLEADPRKIKNAMVAGFLFLAIGNGGVMWALQYVDSGFTALIISTQPLVLLLQMWFHQGKKIQMFSWIGVFLGIVGIYLLISQDSLVYNPNQWKGIIVIFGCLLSWGYGSIFVGKADLPKNHFLNTSVQMLAGGFVLLIVSVILKEEWPLISELSSKIFYSMVYLIIFGSIIAFTAFNFLLKYISPEKVSTNTYVNPVVALLLGWVVLGELITMQSIIAAVILLLGVYFIRKKKELT